MKMKLGIVFLSLGLAIACGKDDKKKDDKKDNNKPATELTSEPDKKDFDAALVGAWMIDFGDFYKEEMNISDKGEVSIKMWLEGELIADYVASGEVDLSTSPYRAKLTVTKVNQVADDFSITEGAEQFCIYETADSQLKMLCDTDYPDAFDDDTSEYTKK